MEIDPRLRYTKMDDLKPSTLDKSKEYKLCDENTSSLNLTICMTMCSSKLCLFLYNFSK